MRRALPTAFLAVSLAHAGNLPQELPKLPRPPQSAPDWKHAPHSVPKDPDRPLVPVRALASATAARRTGSAAASDAETRARAVVAAPQQVLFDTPGDGRLWCLGADWKASFGADGATFFVRSGTHPAAAPVTFTLASATVAGERLPLSTPTARQLGNRAVLDHGAIREEYRAEMGGAEQVFVFETLPARGELMVDVRCTTALARQNDSDGFVFADDVPRLGYGAAFAVDADGRKVALAAEPTADGRRFRVPAEFVATATLPLSIDPWLSPISRIGSGPEIFGIDLAYDASNDVFLVVWDTIFTPTDIDCYAQRCDGAMVPFGGRITIDYTADCFQSPQVANDNGSNRFFVVAQASADAVSPFWVAGRTVDAGTGGTNAQIVIEKAGLPGHATGDKLQPDVGGDANLTPPTYFTVVWERVYSPTDHDIHFKQCYVDGTTRTAQPSLIENSGAMHRAPRISKSDGDAPAVNQFWAVVFQHQYSPTDEDIVASLVSWDGVVANTPNGAVFAIETSTASEARPEISSSTANDGGTRRWLATYGRARNCGFLPGGADGLLAAFDQNGARSVTSALLTPCNPYRTTIDSDGCRFVVAALYYAATLAIDPLGQVIEHDRSNSGMALSSSTTLASKRAAGGVGLGYGLIAVFSGTSSNMFGRVYEGASATGGFATRATACGNQAAVGWYGDPSPGHPFTIYVSFR